jgi:para-nitrobenzyl esterase
MHLLTNSSVLTRRSFLARSSMALACGAAFPYCSAIAESAKPEFVEVKTAYGRIRGTKSDGLATFRGIPYGGSVSGTNRFKAAPPLRPWTGVRDALQLGAQSPQPGRQGAAVGSVPEDCLFLNVWTPAPDGRKRPVMFYSHGGGFTTGSGGAPYQDGGNLAATWDVVVVATNHRLGLVGYLYLGELGGEEYATSGNQGMLDIRDGLKWVHENIEAFGGDPNNVMIFGESGGGGKTSCLYAMPSAEHYFNKASIESGPGVKIYPQDSAAETTMMALKQLGLEKSDWRKLLDVPIGKLLETQTALGTGRAGPLWMSGGRNGMTGNPRPGGFGPMMDGTILPHHPFDPAAPAISKNKPLIVGSNRDEANFFFAESRSIDVYELTDATLEARLQREFGEAAAPLLQAYRQSRPHASAPDLYVAIATARMIGAGNTVIAERKYAQRGAAVFMYIFTHESDRLIPGTQHTMGAAHAMEIQYKFNNIPRPRLASPPALPQNAAPNAPQGGGMMGDERPSSIQAAHNMSEMWSTFARTGHPGAKGQPAWPAYTTQKRTTMEIDAQCKVVEDPYSPERRVWERMKM